MHHSARPAEMCASPWRHRALIAVLVKREIAGRYRGSMFGTTWSMVHPLLLLSVYTFVFSVVFKARWADAPAGSRAEFAIVLFAGLLVHGLLAECINRAPGLMLAHPNYVKKVAFPLEVLPIVALGSAQFHTAVNVAVLLAAQLIVYGRLPWTILLFPVVMVPLVLAAVGSAWFLAALGVYLRDVTHLTGPLTTILLFVSPVFFPVDSVPVEYRQWLALNPLTFIIESSRDTLIFGRVPDAGQWLQVTAASLAFSWLGFAWFQKTRKGFADVV